PNTPPDYLAPTSQDFFAWPMWGQYYQTRGSAGQKPDLPEAKRLMQLYQAWHGTEDADRRAHEDQAVLIAKHGGRDALLAMEQWNFTPADSR
ncbi:MAG: hypothetical protein AAFP68_15465, partial [Pseudomonadota bacterium]